MKNIILLFFILAFASCQNYYRTKETERNEILRIFRNFKSLELVSSGCCSKETQHYSLIPNTLRNNEFSYYTVNQFDSLIFELEGLENASSKLCLDEFVYMISYEKEKDKMSIWFNDTSGAEFQDGKWIESDNSHDLFSNW